MRTFSRSLILKLVAWSCLVVLGVLSLLPSASLKRTGFGGHLEHFVAYLLTAGIFYLAYRSRRQSVMIAIGLAAAAALFEAGQYFSAGRTPALADWVASTSGVVVGGFIGLLVARRLPSRDSNMSVLVERSLRVVESVDALAAAINDVVHHELGGGVELSLPPTGVRCEIEAPLSRVARNVD